MPSRAVVTKLGDAEDDVRCAALKALAAVHADAREDGDRTSNDALPPAPEACQLGPARGVEGA